MGRRRPARSHIKARYTAAVRWVADLVYLLAAVITSPVWLWRMTVTGKIRTDWRGRFGAARPLERGQRPRVLIHAVSVGEVNAVRFLVQRLEAGDAAPEIVISATTDTGVERARSLFGNRHPVVRFPFDFSWAVSRFLNAIRPDVVVLTELEVWPNFMAQCERTGIDVCVVNGRLSQRSFGRYRLIAPLIRPGFQQLGKAAVQTAEYAARFQALGVAADRIAVTGTMKWDTAEIADHVAGAESLAIAMGIDRSRPLVVAGSTAPDEHALFNEAVPEGVQLLCAPRRPEWFEAAAVAMPGCARRSKGDRGSSTGRFLLDTIGELRLAYALAEVVIVGRTFGHRHGSDMMEPVALGKATIVGPAVSDFRDVVDALLQGQGVVQARGDQLASILASLLSDSRQRAMLAERGRAVIQARQGATDRHVELIRSMISRRGETHRDIGPGGFTNAQMRPRA